MARWRSLQQLRDDFKASGIDLGLPIRKGPATRGCSGKVRHPSRRHAQAVVAELMASSRDHVARSARLQDYRCRVCGFWHVGHDGRRLPN